MNGKTLTRFVTLEAAFPARPRVSKGPVAEQQDPAKTANPGKQRAIIQSRRAKRGRRRVTGRGPLPDLRLIQALPPQHPALLPTRGRLVLRDHPSLISRGEGPTNRARSRIHHILR